MKERLREETWPDHVKYYEGLTDLTAVWTIYHTAMVANGKPAAIEEILGMVAEVTAWKGPRSQLGRQRPMEQLSAAMRRSARDSWYNLIGAISSYRQFENEKIWKLRNEMQLFWRTLTRVNDLGKKVSRTVTNPEDFDVAQIVANGIGTAYLVLPFIILHDLAQEPIDARAMAVNLSMVDLSKLDLAISQIGIDVSVLRPTNLDLLDVQARSGLKKESLNRLRENKVSPTGKALGCPMPKNPSAEMNEYLRDHGFETGAGVGTKLLLDLTRIEVLKLLEWYQGLSLSDRDEITISERLLLDKAIENR